MAYAESFEIRYDSGTYIGYVGARISGVRFSLPESLDSARLLTVRFVLCESSSCNGPVAETVHIAGPDHLTELTAPIATAGFGGSGRVNELDVSNRGIEVHGDFYIIFQGATQSLIALASSKSGRSFLSPPEDISLNGLTMPTDVDMMVRVVMTPMGKALTGTSTSTKALETLSTNFVPQTGISNVGSIFSGVVVGLLISLPIVFWRAKRQK